MVVRVAEVSNEWQLAQGSAITESEKAAVPLVSLISRNTACVCSHMRFYSITDAD